MSAGINFVADENEYRGDPEDWNEQSINALGGRYQTWANDNAFPVETPSEFMLQNRTFGLTKREYFAAMAMQGLLASRGNMITKEGTARQAIEQAEALIEQLNKQ